MNEAFNEPLARPGRLSAAARARGRLGQKIAPSPAKKEGLDDEQALGTRRRLPERTYRIRNNRCRHHVITVELHVIGLFTGAILGFYCGVDSMETYRGFRRNAQ